MKCLLNMTIKDLDAIYNKFKLYYWAIRDSFEDTDYRAIATTKSYFRNVYDYLYILAHEKGIFKNKCLQKQINLNEDYIKPEIVSWIDSLKFMHTIINFLPDEFKNDFNLIMEYCLQEKVYNNNTFYSCEEYRADYILTYKNQMYFIEIAEIPSNKRYDKNQLHIKKSGQNQKYIELFEPYLTKEQLELIDVFNIQLYINTKDSENVPENNFNKKEYARGFITGQAEYYSDTLLCEFLSHSYNKPNTNLAYNILKAINNYIPPEI